MNYREIKSILQQKASPEKAQVLQRFFKTGVGQYGHGDRFLGINTPVIRQLAKEAINLKETDLCKFIKSKYHEERLLGLITLCQKYQKAKDQDTQAALYELYCRHFPYINNWDLVDVTCPHIIGKHLMDKDRSVLVEWAKSDDLWIKRIAMVSNWWFIRHGDLRSVFTISKILLKDEHDLIHKAVGWMLREAAKKDQQKVEKFIQKHYHQMPRTALRYAIERFDKKKRLRYLKGEFH